MPYILRNDAGAIIGTSSIPEPSWPTQEFLADDDAEVAAFDTKTGPALPSDS